MAELGLNAYRFSIAWSLMLPSGRGEIHQVRLDYYSRLVDALLAKGITPFPTLFHWDMPQARTIKESGYWYRDLIEKQE